MRRSVIVVCLPVIFASCISGYTVRQTIMERSFDEGFTERLVLLYDYHKADDAVSTEQSKALIEAFAQIRAQDPSAELFLERPELNDVTRNVNRFLTTLTEHGEKTDFVFSDALFETVKKNGAVVAPELTALFSSIHDHDVKCLLPVIKAIFADSLALQGIGGDLHGQLLVALQDAFEGVNGVRFLDQRVGVISLAAALLFPAVLVPLFFNTLLYDPLVQRVKDLDISLHHVFSYINVFLDETIERCDHAQLFFTVCPNQVRDEINAIKSACAALKQTVASRMHGLMCDDMYKVSVVDFLTNVTRHMYGRPTDLPAVAVRYDTVFAQKKSTLDAYVQTTFADMYVELLKLLLQSSRIFSLYDAWLASEMIRSSAKTIIIVTGFAHAERLIPLLCQNGFEMVYDSPVHLVNGMRADALQPFFTSEALPLPALFNARHPVLKSHRAEQQSSRNFIQNIYQSLSFADAYVTGIKRYHELIDIKPFDARGYALMLVPTEELKSLHHCCPYDQHHALRTVWHLPLPDDMLRCD